MNLINVLNARKVIASKAQVKGISFGTALKFAKFLRATDEDENFYNQKREELIGNLAMKDENGQFVVENGQYKFTNENFEEFKKQLSELAMTEIEIPENLKFSAQELEKMEFTIEEVSILYGVIIADDTTTAN